MSAETLDKKGRKALESGLRRSIEIARKGIIACAEEMGQRVYPSWYDRQLAAEQLVLMVQDMVDSIKRIRSL